MNERTLNREISFNGVGLHSGKAVSMRFIPAKPGSGIVFVRTDLVGRSIVKADIASVTSTARGTGLGDIVNTVEHVLSALNAFSVTNLEIELNAPEVPAFDGGASAICESIRSAGPIDQKVPLRALSLSEPVVVWDGDACAAALPHDRFAVGFMINYPVPFIGAQYYSLDVAPASFEREIAPARTYGFTSELDELKQKGLALGAGTDNAVAIGPTGYLNGLRFHNELVRHKILDMIGDLSLLRCEMKARILGIRSGHALNVALAKKLAAHIKEAG